MKAAALFVFILAVLLGADTLAGPLDETRYCGPPARDADGRIARRADVLRAFRQIHPCPATGQARGRCDGWNIAHTIPLACGGCDSVANLSWLPVQIKRCAGQWCKDRWERRVYCRVSTPSASPSPSPGPCRPRLRDCRPEKPP